MLNACFGGLKALFPRVMSSLPWVLLALLSGWQQFSRAGETYPNTEGMGVEENKNAGWYRACLAVKDVEPPKGDLPSGAQRRANAHCVANDLYYDTKYNPSHTDADWGPVRACAFATDQTGVLMMLYANGLGVARNPRLALKYACATSSSRFEMLDRVDTLSKMSVNDRKTDFDLCDAVGGGPLLGYCAAREERQRNRARQKKIAGMTGRFSRAELAEFNRLHDLADAFADARARLETDATGSARAVFANEAEAEQKKAFAALFKDVERGALPAYSASEVEELDRQLNEVYRKIMACKGVRADEPDRLGDTTLTKADVKQAERLWIKYRDAWLRFARVRHPQLDPAALTGYLTMRRVEQLRELLKQATD